MASRATSPAAGIDVSDRNLAAVIDTVSDAVIVTDEPGRILLFNTEACTLFGTSRTEVLGRRFTELLPQAAELISGSPPRCVHGRGG